MDVTAGRPFDDDAVRAHRRQVCAAGDEGDVGAAAQKVRTEQTSDTAGSHNSDFHSAFS
jgi:hypothetical protein